MAFLVALAFYARHTWTNFADFTVDDAAISYAYAHNLAHGHGARATPNSPPVEGYSNPLEVGLLVPVALFGGNLDTAAKLFNLGAVVLGALALGLACARRMSPWGRLLVAVPPVLVALLFPAFHRWTLAGLEGGLVCGMQLLALAILVESHEKPRDVALGMVALLLALTRPEAPVYAAIVVAARCLLPGRRHLPALIFAAGFAAFLLLRYALFRHWLPNTYYAKIAEETPWKAGTNYVAVFLDHYPFLAYLAPLPLVPLFIRAVRPAALAALGFAAFAVCFAMRSGGDWMRDHRFMQSGEGALWAVLTLALAGAWMPGIRRRWAKVTLACLPILLLVPFARAGLKDWFGRQQACMASRDVDTKKIAAVGSRYIDLGNRLDLGRPLLVADVDVGGMSYPPGLDVVDLFGLTDLTFGHDFARHPTRIVDYLFGQRRPDTIHMHGSWLATRPMDQFSPFAQDYRVMGPLFLQDMWLGAMTAIRAEWMDPPAPPMIPLRGEVGALGVLGASSMPTASGSIVLLVHGYRRDPALPPQVTAWDASGGRTDLRFHLGSDVAPGPVGTPLVAHAVFPAKVLPVAIAGITPQITQWPHTHATDDKAAALFRFPLRRAGYAPFPTCPLSDFIDDAASVGARARGLSLMARLCQAAFPRPERLARAAGIADEAARLPATPDRAAADDIHFALGVPPSIGQVRRMEKARRTRWPLDEVAQAWAYTELSTGANDATTVATAVELFRLARRPDEAMITAYARGAHTWPLLRPSLCDARALLGLRAEPFAPLRCADAPAPLSSAIRQDFDGGPAPGDLRATHADLASLLNPTGWVWLGGQGDRVLALPPCDKPPCPEVAWGPLDNPGDRFGVLVAGVPDLAKVDIEEQTPDGWRTLRIVPGPQHEIILTPRLVRLPDGLPSPVRVRIRNLSPHKPMFVDAPTFLRVLFPSQ